MERGVDQCLVTSLVEGLNPTWHSAAWIVWGNVTVTMAEMHVGVICQGRVGQGVVNCYSILKTTVTGLIVTLHQHFHYK